MRIVAGEWRGRRLTPLGKGDAAAQLRPTSDRIREALFNMLGSGRFGAPFAGTFVLDLFAGSGALGLEALSRGAQRAYFVENGGISARLIEANIRLLSAQAQAQLIRSDVMRLSDGPACDLVFLDPPYGKNLGAPALCHAKVKGRIAPGALIVWEENTPQDTPDGFHLLEHRQYGETFVTLLEAQSNVDRA